MSFPLPLTFRGAIYEDVRTIRSVTVIGRFAAARNDLVTTWLVTWRSGNGVGRINDVTLRQARLVLGWVTCPGGTPGGGTLFRYVTSHPGRLSLSSFRGR